MGPTTGQSEASDIALPKAMSPTRLASPMRSQALQHTNTFHEMVTALDITGSALGQSFADNKAKREKFRRDAHELREHLRKTRAYLINPRSRRVQYWDLTTCAALLFVATVTPFEVGMAIETRLGGLFIINSVINMVFIVDIGVQFFMPVPGKDGELIRDHKALAKRYLTGWFLLDVATCLPFDSIALAAPDLVASDGCSSGSGALLKGVRLLRILRLVKLLRVLRASRIVRRWESAITISSSMRSMGSAWVAFLLLLHWLACLWAMLPQLQDSWREDSRLAAAIEARAANDSSCVACVCSIDTESPACRHPCLTDCEIEEVMAFTGFNRQMITNRESWMCRAVRNGYLQPDFEDQPFSVWLVSGMVALLELLGSTSIVFPTNDAEVALFMVCTIIGTIVFAAVQGTVISVFTTGNPDETAFRQTLDGLNYMMNDQKLPDDLKLRVREYFLRTRSMYKRKAYFDLIDTSLSRKLKGDVKVAITAGVFNSVWWLQECEPSFLEELSTHLTREAFASNEMIPNFDEHGDWRMCLIVGGLASRAGTILTSGHCWGDIIVASPTLRDARVAKALAYCEIVSLSRSGLEACVASYPISALAVREAGIKLATQRAIILIASYAHFQESRDKAHPKMNGKMKAADVLRAMRADGLIVESPWLEPEEMSVHSRAASPTGSAVGDLSPIAADGRDSPTGALPMIAPTMAGSSRGGNSQANLASLMRGQAQTLQHLKKLTEGMHSLMERMERLERDMSLGSVPQAEATSSHRRIGRLDGSNPTLVSV